MKSAIVTTLVNDPEVIDFYVSYHLSIGFDRIYLFNDAPGERSLDKFKSDEKVVVIERNDALLKLWKKMPSYTQVVNYLDKEVMARQIVNMEVAVQFAAFEKIEWILHIDLDELFYLPGVNISTYFDELSQLKVDAASINNYEGIPDVLDAKNYFTATTLFKKNPNEFSQVQAGYYKANYIKNFYNGYGNGKMVGRVDVITRGAIHDFSLVPGSNKIRYPYTGTTHTPIILHYLTCSLTTFWNKFRRLGLFEDLYFGQSEIPQLYLKARDVVAKDDFESAKDFFKKNVMMSESKKEQLLELGLLVRLPEITCKNKY
jgi:hypothetical protein